MTFRNSVIHCIFIIVGPLSGVQSTLLGLDDQDPNLPNQSMKKILCENISLYVKISLNEDIVVCENIIACEISLHVKILLIENIVVCENIIE